MSLLTNVPLKYNGYNKMALISAGNIHVLFRSKFAKNFGWGDNINNSLGDNANINRYIPVVIALYGLNKTFCKIVAGGGHSLAIDKNGRVWSWGLNNVGQLGDDLITNKCYPTPPRGQIKTFCEISAGLQHSLAIDKNGRVWGWGQNSVGQLGDNTTVSKRTPVSVLGAVKTFCQISLGGGTTFHSLAIDKNGRVWGWGSNGSGRIGDNSSINRLTPVSIAGAAKTFCQISAGTEHSVAINKDGRAWCWGNNAFGQLGDNTTINRLTPVSVLGAVKTFCQIRSGASHAIAIDKNGRAWSWGANSDGRLGDNSTINRLTPVSVAGAVKTFCQITGGGSFSLAIDKNGRVWSWGNNPNGSLGNSIACEISPVSLLGAVKTFCDVVSGDNHMMAIDKNGRAWGWGNAAQGRIGDNSTNFKRTPVSLAGVVKTFCQISAGGQHSVAIDKNGRAWGWGNNNTGQLGDNTTVSKLTPVSVAGTIKTFCQITGGGSFSLAIDKNGRVWSWGVNSTGQLGDNTTVSKRTPVSVLGAVKTFCQINSGNAHAMAIDKNGRAWGWGQNSNGRLGDNSVINRLTPVSVGGTVKTFCNISGGTNHSLALDKNGRAWSWGLSNFTQLGNGDVLWTYSPIEITGGTKTFCGISVGDGFSTAIDKNGRAWAWGANNGGQLGDDTTTNRFSPISVQGAVKTFCKINAGAVFGSTGFVLALDKYGRAWSWGYNGVGQLGINSTTSQRTPVSVLGGVKTFCEISNGVNQPFALAIDKNGRVWSWGVNGTGQLGNNTVISQRTPVSVVGAVKTFCKVSVGGFHSLAIDKNGRLWAWGNNSNGQLGNNTWGNSVSTPVSVLGAIKTFCHIAGGNSQSVAIDKNGQAWGWGFNSSGANGDGGGSDNLTPVSVLGQKKTFCKIASGNGVSLSIDNYGRLWAWGFNGNVQIGDLSSIPKRTPVRVCNNKTFCEVKGGNNHVLAIEKNGQVWAWGNNSLGQLANPYSSSTLTPVSIAGVIKTFCQIQASNNSSFALDKDGKIWAWGNNNNGVLGLGHDIGFIITPRKINNKTFCKIGAVNGSAGFSNVAIDKNGRVWTWGVNTVGQLGTNNFFASVLTPVRVCVI
jgi:alpha-tubulin suppressor-like RCC1 family protein